MEARYYTKYQRLIRQSAKLGSFSQALSNYVLRITASAFMHMKTRYADRRS